MKSSQEKNSPISTEQQELLNLQTNAVNDNTNREPSSTKLVERTKLVGTPFTLVQYGMYYYIMMGRYRLNETEFDTKEEALQYLETNTYDIVLKMIGIMLENPLNKDQNK